MRVCGPGDRQSSGSWLYVRQTADNMDVLATPALLMESGSLFSNRGHTCTNKMRWSMEPDYLRIWRLSSGSMWIPDAFSISRKVSAGGSWGGGIRSRERGSSAASRTGTFSFCLKPREDHPASGLRASAVRCDGDPCVCLQREHPLTSVGLNGRTGDKPDAVMF